MINFIVNNTHIQTEAHPGTILLDFLRDELKLYGTKEGCKEGECGSCTVLLGALDGNSGLAYRSVASCLLPIGDLNGRHVVTIEGVNLEELNAVQRAVFSNNASQCGFCTPGIVLSLTYFALTSKDFSYEEAVDALDGNICRCTGYVSIRNAAKSICGYLSAEDYVGSRIDYLVRRGVLPQYFAGIRDRLKAIKPEEELKYSHGTTVVAGGTDLFVQKPDELLEREILFVSQKKGFDYIRKDGALLRVGSGVNLESFRNSCVTAKYFPFMKGDILLHSSTILRNQATIAGNIVNASPIADITIMLLVLNASLVIEGNGEERTVYLDRFYQGYKKFDLKEGEIIKEICIPEIPGGALYNFEKVSNRKILDIAAVNSSILISKTSEEKIDFIKISVGGVAPVPLLIDGLERFIGYDISYETVREIADHALSKISPIDDVRGSANYKRLLFRQLIFAHFNKLFGVKVCLGEGC